MEIDLAEMWRYTKDKTATWRIPKGSPSAGVYRVQADGDWEMEPHFEEDLFAENPDVRRNWEAVAHCKKSIAYELMRLSRAQIQNHPEDREFQDKWRVSTTLKPT